MGKVNILCYALGLILGSVALAVALPIAQDAWKADEHVKGLIWSSVVAVLVVAAVLVGALPMALQADTERAAEAPKGLAGDQRPWLTVKSATLIQDFAVGKALRAVIRVTNTGRTPALDVVITGDIVSREAIELVAFEAEKLSGPASSVMVVAPGAVATVEITSGNTTIQSQAHIDGLLDGPYKLFARGFIAYKDISGNSHKTLYCFKAEGRDDLIRMAQLGVGMSACDRWNTAE